MRNHTNFVLLTVIAICLSACATKVKILDTAAISTTRGALEPGEKLRQLGSVHGRFCPQTLSDTGNIGLIDEAVKSAQRRYSVDFIMDATFWNESGCITVEGTGAKVVNTKSSLSPAATRSVKRPKLASQAKRGAKI